MWTRLAHAYGVSGYMFRISYMMLYELRYCKTCDEFPTRKWERCLIICSMSGLFVCQFVSQFVSTSQLSTELFSVAELSYNSTTTGGMQ